MPTLNESDVTLLVEDKLADYLQKKEMQKLRRIEFSPQKARPYSEICLISAHTDTALHCFVMKRILSHPLNSATVAECEQACVEYEVLDNLYPQFANEEHCRVPKPIAVFPEQNALLMEYVSGHDMAEDLRFLHYLSSPLHFEQLQNNFYYTGLWLRRLFEFSGRRFQDISALDGILAFCHDRLKLIEESKDPRCPKGFTDKAVAFLDVQVKALRSMQIPVAGLHRDFGPWNILANPSSITVIDFFGYCNGPTPVSVFSVLIFLESIGYGMANNPHRLKLLRERFLDGLGPCPNILDPLALLCEAHQRIIHVSGAIIAKGGHLLRRLERSKGLKAHIQWLTHPPSHSRLWPQQNNEIVATNHLPAK